MAAQLDHPLLVRREAEAPAGRRPPGQRQLSDTMIDIWTGFARTGHAPWPTTPTVQSLAPGHLGPADAWTDHQCDFWQTQLG